MGKQTQIVQINSNFTKGKKDLQIAFADHPKAELYAEGAYIETAISVSEHVVDTLKTAAYLRINSGLLEQKEGKIPFVRIELAAKEGRSYKEAEHAYQARQSNPGGERQGKKYEEGRKQYKQHEGTSYQSRTGHKDRYQ